MPAAVLLLLAMCLMVTSCVHSGDDRAIAAVPRWQLVYEHDAHGNSIDGSKQALIEAVRSGKPVRIYWAGRRVEHVADSFFLTILGGEVFAQIETIQGQAPAVDPPTIEFRDNQWRTILATNGKLALKWFSLTR